MNEERLSNPGSKEPLSATHLDAARRLGRTAGLLAKSQAGPEAVAQVPKWVGTCLRLVSEAAGQGAGAAVDGIQSGSPRTIGFALGNLGSLLGLMRSPTEAIGSNLQPFMEAYFAAYFSELGIAPPPNFWDMFAQLIVGSFLAAPYEQRIEYVEGLRVGTEIEQSVRNGATRETTATRVYLELLLYWPEIARMESLSQVHDFLRTRFVDSPGLLGEFERFRKLANRIELSFRAE